MDILRLTREDAEGIIAAEGGGMVKKWSNFIQFQREINEVARRIHRWAKEKGFYKERPNHGEKIALMHSELSEALEILRDKEGPLNIKSKSIPEFLAIEEELADTIIRVLDYAGFMNLRIGEAIIAKMDFNEGRPYMHGKEF